MKKYSKRLLCSCISAIWLIGTYSLAGTTGMSITLAPGWNVVSTPAILSSLSFSNGGNGISFSKLVNEKRQTVSATTENIKPLEWFMVNNSNTSAVTLTMQYKAGVSVTESLLKSDLNQGRNLLGITTTDHPFAHLTGASMSVDFTNGTSQGVPSNFTINTTSKEVSNPQLWKAYGIFVNEKHAIYGGVNNGGIAIDEESTWWNTWANTGSNVNTWWNSWEIWSGTTNTSGTNEGVIFQNELEDVVIYLSWFHECFQWESRNNNSIFSGCSEILLSSWIINTEWKFSFTVLQENNLGGWVNLYLWDHEIFGENTKINWKNAYIFKDLIVQKWDSMIISISFSNLNFSWLTGNVNMDFSLSGDYIPGLSFRKISLIKDTSLFTIDNDSSIYSIVNQNEKTSQVVYSWLLSVFHDNFTIDRLYWEDNELSYDFYHAQRFYHVYINDIEIWNSDMDRAIKGETNRQQFYGTWYWVKNKVTIHSWDQATLKVVEDFLLFYRDTNPNDRYNLNFLMRLWGVDSQWVWYSFSITGSNLRINQLQNVNMLSGNFGTLAHCEIGTYSYANCIHTGNENKIVMFSGNYYSENDQVHLTWFALDHLSWETLNKIHLNFELYIDHQLVKSFGMNEINKIHNLDTIIQNTPSNIQLLAVLVNPEQISRQFNGVLSLYGDIKKRVFVTWWWSLQDYWNGMYKSAY